MEVTNHEVGDSHPPVTITTSEAAALDIIRTETVLSRMPVHNLAKRGNVNIQILKTTADGKVELKWIVSYSDRYGQARQLAYKLDTIVINHHIDEQGRPLPQMICLGSLRDIADQLDLGGDTNKVRRALRQNASAFITAKFEYRGNDGSKKTLEADFTRYSVVFTGEQLPDGRRADAVYIILNEPYREVLNNAPVRPLDRAYMKALPPGAQRFYEIISYKIFSAIKNDYPHAKIPYSEYCTFSAQLRHYERQPVQDQMAKVIRPHKQSGYIAALRYEPTIDAENKPDWILYLTPGPKAHAEFDAAHGRKSRKAVAASGTETGDDQPHHLRSAVREQPIPSKPVARQTFDPQLLAEFTNRGITEQKATEILANLKPGQDVVAQLESAEQTVKALQNTPTPVRNPPGFYIRLIERNTPVPDNFETSAKRKAREEKERKERDRRAVHAAREELEWEYDRYCAAEVDHYIQANPAEFESLKNQRAAEERTRRPSSWPELIETAARIGAKNAIQKKLSLLTFEEFVDHKKPATDFSLKLVGLSPVAESLTKSLEPEVGTPNPLAELVEAEAVSGTLAPAVNDEGKPGSAPVTEASVEAEAPDVVPAEPIVPAPVTNNSPPKEVPNYPLAPATAGDTDGSNVDRGDVPQLSPESVARPAISEPIILLGAKSPEAKPDTNATQPDLA
jgi:hypothetical protein